jgi:hypothetical protein
MMQQMKLERQNTTHKYKHIMKFIGEWQLHARGNYYSFVLPYVLASLQTSGCPYYDDIVKC